MSAERRVERLLVRELALMLVDVRRKVQRYEREGVGSSVYLSLVDARRMIALVEAESPGVIDRAAAAIAERGRKVAGQ